MSSDKSKYSIYLLNKKTPSYSGSSKSPISFAKMFIKNCNLKNKSITFYVKNCKNKKLYGPYLGNVNTKTVKLQKNKQRGGDIRIIFNTNFLNRIKNIFEGKYVCFEIKTDDDTSGVTSMAGNILSANIYCKKNLLGNGFTISTDGSFDRLQTDTLKQAKDYLYDYDVIKMDSEIKTMPALNTTNALTDQRKLNQLEKENNGAYPLIKGLNILYQNKALRTAYDELCKMYVGRHLSSVSQFITPSSFALLPNNLDATYKISFSTLGRNPHIFFRNMKTKVLINNPNYNGIKSGVSSINIEIQHYFGYLLYKNISGHVMYATLLIYGEYPNFTYKVDGYYDLIDPDNSKFILSQKDLTIIRDAIFEYRRVYNQPTFATTILNFVISKLLPTSPS